MKNVLRNALLILVLLIMTGCAEPEEQKYELKIISNMGKATVFIDEQGVGVTDQDGSFNCYLKPGYHTLKMIKYNPNGVIIIKETRKFTKIEKKEKIEISIKKKSIFDDEIKKQDRKKEFTELRRNEITVSDFENEDSTIAIKIHFYEDVFTEEIRDFIEIDPETDYSYQTSNNSLKLYGEFKPDSNYTLKIKKGFKTYSKEIKYDFSFPIRTKNLDEKLKFKDKKRYVSSYSEALDLACVNLKNAQISIVKVNDENVNYLSLFKSYYLNDSYYYDELDSYGKKINKFTLNIDSKPNEIKTVQVNLKNSLKNQPSGIYAINAKNEQFSTKDTKLLIKSDIGISTKISKDQMFFMFRSLSDNSPLSDVAVKVYDGTNRLVFMGHSDESGIFLKDYKNIASEKPSLVIAEWNNEINFISLGTSVSKYNILRDNEIGASSPYSALLFFERSLVRPGDKTNILIAAKDNDFISLKNKTVTFKITDPTQKNIVNKSVRLNSNGVAEYIFEALNSSKTGTYRAEVFRGKSQIGYHEFKVETFLPEKIEVSLTTDKDTYETEDTIKLNIKSKYLFGTPASGLKSEAELTTLAKKYQSEKFKDYVFYNFETKKNRDIIFENISKDLKLDEKGEIIVEFPISLKKTNESVLEATILATVYDDGRAVRKYKTVDIFPFDSIAGIKRIGKGTLEVGQKEAFETILIDPKLDKVIDGEHDVTIEIYKEFWHYYAGYELRRIERFTQKTNNTFTYAPEESGSYVIAVKNSNGQISSLSFSASGWDYEPISLRNKTSYKLQITPDKKLYKPGEKMMVNIKSPIPGKLLLTFEENKILKHKLFDMTNNTYTAYLTVPEDAKKGFYLKGQVLRSTETGDKILPYRVIGKKYLKIDNSEHSISVNINTPKTTTSNTKLKVSINSDSGHKANVVISMVDLGILNIIDEKNTDAFEYFTKRIKDKVSLFDIYSDLLSLQKLKTHSFSGDAGITKKREKHLAPDAMNKRVKPFSFWSKIITLDENGSGEHIFEVPEFNGQALIQAVVVDENRIGSSHTKITIKDDIIVKPVLPRFLIAGDEFSVPVRIFNTTDQKKTLELFFESSNKFEISNPVDSLSINAKENYKINLKVKAKKEGEASIKIIARDALQNEYTSSTAIYIQPQFDTKIISKNGIIGAGGREDLDFSDVESAENKDITAHIFISDSPYIHLKKSIKYLIGYPYGCAEQTSSKIMAMLFSNYMLDNKNPANRDLLSKRDEFIKEGIAKLLSMQNFEGFFTYWPGGSDVNHYASTYALTALLMAKNFDYYVPKDALISAMKADQKYYSNNPQKAYSFLYISGDEKIANYLYDRKLFGKNLSDCIVLASVMKKHGNMSAFNKLMEKAKHNLKTGAFKNKRRYTDDFYSDIKDIAFSLMVYHEVIMKHRKDDFSKNLASIVNRYIREERLYSTQDKAYAMMAIGPYYDGELDSDGPIDATITFDGNQLTAKDILYKKAVLKGKNVNIENNGKLISYSVDLDVPTRLPVNKESYNKGDNLISVKTTLFDGKHVKVDDFNNIQLGQKLFLEVDAYSTDDIENVVINAKIPAGFEIMNPRLYKINTSLFMNGNYKPAYEDYRDDRVLSFINSKARLHHKYFIPLIATTEGRFTMPAVYIEAMYDSRINNYFKEVHFVEISYLKNKNGQ